MFAAALPPPAPPSAAAVAAAPQATAPSPLLSITGPTQQVASHGFHYTVIGNRLLSAADVAAALARATTPRAAVGDLKQAYMAKGYFLVALVAHVEGKEVRVQVVQGRLTHIEGPHALTRFFDGLKGDDTIQERDVIRRSTLAQAYAATNGQQPQIKFAPAPEVGGSSMEIGQQPAKDYFPVSGGVTFGNFGNRYAARYLAQAQVAVQQWGYTLQLTHSRALTGLSNNTRGAAYFATGASLTDVTPLGTFELDANFTRYRLGQAFAPLFPLGRIQTYGASATQLLYADAATRWTLNEGVQHIHDSDEVFAGTFTLFDQRYDVGTVGSDFSHRFSGLAGHVASVAAGGAVKIGGAPANSGFTNATGSPTAHFQIYTAHANLTQTLPKNFSLAVDLNGQASHQTVPEYEQWVLGGINNVTAYLPGSIVGDAGYLGRLTLQGPAWKPGPLQLQPSVFTEYGAAKHTFVPQDSSRWQGLTDAGVGLAFGVPRAHLSGMLAYARPLSSHGVTDKLRVQQRAHLFFYLQLAL